MPRKPLAAAVVMASATLFAHAPALAQQEQEIVEIVVVAPKITRETVTTETRPGSLTEVSVIEKNARIGLEDLDLNRTADVRELEQRVRETAEAICQELDEEYPFGEPNTATCIDRAVEDAMVQVDRAIEQSISR